MDQQGNARSPRKAVGSPASVALLIKVGVENIRCILFLSETFPGGVEAASLSLPANCSLPEVPSGGGFTPETAEGSFSVRVIWSWKSSSTRSPWSSIRLPAGCCRWVHQPQQLGSPPCRHSHGPGRPPGTLMGGPHTPLARQ